MPTQVEAAEVWQSDVNDVRLFGPKYWLGLDIGVLKSCAGTFANIFAYAAPAENVGMEPEDCATAAANVDPMRRREGSCIVRGGLTGSLGFCICCNLGIRRMVHGLWRSCYNFRLTLLEWSKRRQCGNSVCNQERTTCAILSSGLLQMLVTFQRNTVKYTVKTIGEEQCVVDKLTSVLRLLLHPLHPISFRET